MNTFTSFASLQKFLLQREKIRHIPTFTHLKNAYVLLFSHLDKKPIQFIQVLGTNGKGSTSTYLEALAIEHSLSTGLFTSPHFLSMRERIRCNGKMLSEDDWLEAANYTEHYISTEKLLTFEYFLLIALYLFNKYSISLAVMEAGLGGMHDATSLLPHCVQILTSIDIDHQHILGNTIEEIAFQKVSALQENVLCVSTIQKDEILPIIENIAKKKNIQLFYSNKNFSYTPSLKGDFQKDNASLALLAFSLFLSIFEKKPDENAVKKAFKNAFIAGRNQHIELENRSLLLDGAHNNNSLLALKNYIQDIPISYIIFSTKSKKNIAEYLSLLHSFSLPTLYVSVNEKNMCSFQDLCHIAPFLKEMHSLQEALHFSIKNTPKDKTILITGSLYLLASFFFLYPQFLRSEYI